MNMTSAGKSVKVEEEEEEKEKEVGQVNQEEKR